MDLGPQSLLVAAVAVVGVLHTAVPDHWAPIALLARQRGWSRIETARAALLAGTGHVGSTLVIAALVWLAGAAAAARFGAIVDAAASAALVLFGGWIAVSSWRRLHRGHGHSHTHGHGHSHGHAHPHRHDHDVDEPEDDPLYAPLRGAAAVAVRHVHLHRHGRGMPHLHWHDHLPASAHAVSMALTLDPPAHEHRHPTALRTALLLILGSSPMIEGIPAFFAAGQYGPRLVTVMAAVFALATIATYVALCVLSAAGLQRLRLGPVERYGEVLSGALIAAIGIVFWLATAE